MYTLQLYDFDTPTGLKPQQAITARQGGRRVASRAAGEVALYVSVARQGRCVGCAGGARKQGCLTAVLGRFPENSNR